MKTLALFVNTLDKSLTNDLASTGSSQGIYDHTVSAFSELLVSLGGRESMANVLSHIRDLELSSLNTRIALNRQKHAFYFRHLLNFGRACAVRVWNLEIYHSHTS